MAYDEDLDARVGEIVTEWGAVRKKMFGGSCYLLDGNMLTGVWKHWLIARIGEEAATEALMQPHVVPFDITGPPMRGWIMVDRDGLDDANLVHWTNAARAFVATLPPK